MAGGVTMARGSTTPATPGAGYTTTYPGPGNDAQAQSNSGRLFHKDEFGNISQLTESRLTNWVRNSGFWFAQRQAAGTATTYSATAGRAITADGWGVTNENASATYRRLDTFTLGAINQFTSRYYSEFAKITSNGKLVISQVLESTDVAVLRNRTVRLQAWMANGTSTMRMGLAQLTSAGTIDTMPATFVSAFGGAGVDPTLGTNLSYIAPKAGLTPDSATISGNGLSCTTSGTWARYGGVFDIPQTCLNLVVLFWTNTQLTAGNAFNVTQVSLTDGYEMQDWYPQPLAVEKHRVMRYYQKSFIEATAPAQNVGVNTGESKGIAGKAGAVANSGFVFARYNPPMRTGPGVTLYNPAAANALMRNTTGGADMGATTATSNTEVDLMINATGVAATAVGDQVGIHWSADAEI